PGLERMPAECMPPIEWSPPTCPAKPPPLIPPPPCPPPPRCAQSGTVSTKANAAIEIRRRIPGHYSPIPEIQQNLSARVAPSLSRSNLAGQGGDFEFRLECVHRAKSKAPPCRQRRDKEGALF